MMVDNPKKVFERQGAYASRPAAEKMEQERENWVEDFRSIGKRLELGAVGSRDERGTVNLITPEKLAAPAS